MDGQLLLAAARAAIAEKLGMPDAPRPAVAPDAPERALGAAFVTLTIDGNLRGCIGSLEAWRSLLDDVVSNARSAAFGDPRFRPLTREEYPLVRVEVSVLTPTVPMTFRDEADLRAQLRPNVDGVVFEASGRRATFLPQVWEQLPDPAVFLGHLKRKAGLRETYWGPDVRVGRYQVEKFREGVHDR